VELSSEFRLTYCFVLDAATDDGSIERRDSSRSIYESLCRSTTGQKLTLCAQVGDRPSGIVGADSAEEAERGSEEGNELHFERWLNYIN